MDGSLVKIADTAGNVFYQGRSEGGMVTWNGRNQSGDRVRSGIYFVYVSTGGDGQNSSGAVTKIMFIN
jgi:flagellar hook assembly protein FlgD